MIEGIKQWEHLVGIATDVLEDSGDFWDAHGLFESALNSCRVSTTLPKGDHPVIEAAASLAQIEPYLANVSAAEPQTVTTRKQGSASLGDTYKSLASLMPSLQQRDRYETWHHWVLFMFSEAYLRLTLEGFEWHIALQREDTASTPSVLEQHARDILASHEVAEGILGFEWPVGFARTMETHLMRECKQAWLEWQRLPSYATDPAAAEQFTDNEVEEIVKAEQERLGISELRLANAYYRDKAWLEEYEEFKKAGKKQPYLAVLLWWKNLPQSERVKLAGGEDYAVPLPDDGRGTESRTKALNTIREGIERAIADRKRAQNGKHS